MKTLIRFVLSVSTILLACCGNNQGQEAFPEIAMTNPEDGSSRVFQTSNIEVVFSVAINPSSISSNTFTINDATGMPLPGDVSYDEAALKATFSPSISLKKNTTYTATLAESVFGREYSWSFTTYGFLFVVLSDTHVRIPGNPDDEYYNASQNIRNLTETLATINAKFSSADFVAVTGDMVGNLYSANPDSYGVGFDTPADRFKSIMDSLSMPYFTALGNHDYEVGFNTHIGEGVSAADWQIANVEAVWQKVLGTPPYYALDHDGLRLYFLNSITGNRRHDICQGALQERMCTGSFSEEQMEWFSQDLQQGKKALLFFHHPIYTPDTSPADWSFYGQSFLVQKYDLFYDIISRHPEQILGIFTGHGHYRMQGHLDSGATVFETPATGDWLGEANHMNVVSVFPDTGEYVALERYSVYSASSALFD